MGLFNAGARTDGPMVVHDRIATVANGITALRLLGLPLFVWLTSSEAAFGWGFVTLVVVGTTDWIDGYVARRFDQVTKIGKLIDPLIDRALIATAGITLMLLGLMPWWIVAAVVGRDVLLLGAGFLLFGRANPNIPVSNLGKFATACLLAGVPSFLLAETGWLPQEPVRLFAYAFCIVGIVTYWLAGLRYAQAARTVKAALRNAAVSADPSEPRP